METLGGALYCSASHAPALARPLFCSRLLFAHCSIESGRISYTPRYTNSCTNTHTQTHTQTHTHQLCIAHVMTHNKIICLMKTLIWIFYCSGSHTSYFIISPIILYTVRSWSAVYHTHITRTQTHTQTHTNTNYLSLTPWHMITPTQPSPTHIIHYLSICAVSITCINSRYVAHLLTYCSIFINSIHTWLGESKAFEMCAKWGNCTDWMYAPIHKSPWHGLTCVCVRWFRWLVTMERHPEKVPKMSGWKTAPISI